MKKYWLQLIVLFLIVFLLNQFDISEYLGSLDSLNISTWLILLALQGLSFFLLLAQWIRISNLLGRKVRAREMIAVNMRGIFYETITPGLKVGGELARGMTLINKLGFSSAQASALIVIQKTISILALVVLSILSFILISIRIDLGRSLQVLIIISMFLILFFLFLLLFIPERLYLYLIRLDSEKGILVGARGFLEKYLQSFNKVKKDKMEILLQFFLSIFIWGLFPFKLYYITRAMGLNISFLNAFAATIISYIAGMVPLLPGGLGSFEGTMVGLFLIWGLRKEEGLVIATLFRFTTFWLLFFISTLYLSIGKIRFTLKGAFFR